MGSPAYQRVLDYPGRLATGCTDFTAAWPHGGTGLGFCDEIVITGMFPVHLIQAEELAGASVVEGVGCGEGWAFTCLLRDADPAALALCFPNTATGTVTQRTGVASPGSNRAGYVLSARRAVLAFTPESVVQGFEDQHDMAVLYAALPAVQAQARLEHRLGKERKFPLAFWGIPNSAGVTCQIKPRRDLTAPP